MQKTYSFNPGDRVRIKAGPSSSASVKAHDGEEATIKACCSFTWAYELEELEGLWKEDCFTLVSRFDDKWNTQN